MKGEGEEKRGGPRELLGKLDGVANGSAGNDELSLSGGKVVIGTEDLADVEQTAKDQRNVGTELATVGVSFVEDDEPGKMGRGGEKDRTEEEEGRKRGRKLTEDS